MAHHDALTDLPNRALFAERLARALDERPGREAVTVMCLDLDRFKAVNDTLGHAAGDMLLQHAAAVRPYVILPPPPTPVYGSPPLGAPPPPGPYR